MLKSTILLMALTAFLGTSAFADESKDNKDFAARKAEVSKEVDEHIKALQDHKTCVDAAADPNALKACREKMKEYRHGQMMEHMQGKKERLEKRMDKMKEKKNK